jgi:hypothetical protein
MIKKYFLIIYSILILFAIYGCGTQISGGGGSETNNKITVCVKGFNIEGKCVSGAEVSLYNDTFNPVMNTLPDTLRQFSDKSGIFSFRNVTSGKYNLYTRCDSAGLLVKAALIRSLLVNIDSDTSCSTSYSIPAILNCFVTIDSSANTIKNVYSEYFGYLCIYGTPFYSQENILKTANTVITGVPPGIYSISCTIKMVDTAQAQVPVNVGAQINYLTDNNQDVEVLQGDTNRVLNVSVTIIKK